MMRKWLPFLFSLMLTLGLAVLGTTPPLPKPDYFAADGFSAQHAMRDVEMIAQVPHPSGSAQIENVRDMLVARLEGAGLSVRLQEGTFPETARAKIEARSGQAYKTVPLVNVIGVLKGRDSSLPAVALMAHYDSVYGSPAAADDGAGVASILGVVDTLSRDTERRRDLMVILTDGEETELNGAQMFFAQAPERKRIGALINLEARGGGGKANLFQTSPGNGAVADVWARSVTHPAGSSLATYIYSLLPNDTDLSVALPQGYAAWNFAFIGRPGLYHSPLATPANLDRGSLQQMGEQALGLTRALLHASALPGPSPDTVFFDVFGLFVISYLPGWGWAMLAFGLAGIVGGVWGRFDAREAWGGTARMLALMLATGLGLTALNAISQAGQVADYYDRLAAIPALQAMAILACLGIVMALLAQKPRSPSGFAGFLLLPFLLALALQSVAGVAAYVLVIPVMVCGVAMTVRRFAPPVPALVFDGVGGALVAGYSLAIGYSIFQAVGPGLPAVCVLPVMICAAALAPLRPAITAGRSLWAIAVPGLVGALAIALWVRFDPVAPSVPLYSEARPAVGGK